MGQTQTIVVVPRETGYPLAGMGPSGSRTQDGVSSQKVNCQNQENLLEDQKGIELEEAVVSRWTFLNSVEA